jgi:HlyD family secretion protein
MKRLWFWLVVVAILGAAGAAGWHRHRAAQGGAASYRTVAVQRGNITQTVNSTGAIQPTRSVQVGAIVSGPIQEVFVDFNSKVTKDQVLGRIDPRTYEATVAHEKATLARSQADLARIQALLRHAVREEQRALELRRTKSIAETEVDQLIANRESLEAQLALGKAAISECEANLATAKANLGFTCVKSPVDGIVVDRKVDPGQTMAASFQTPVMFVVAPDLEKRVYVLASVDEADIGHIRKAQTNRQPVSFSVDAYPEDVFEGTIIQIRLNPTTNQNVVTYTVVVESANRDFKLLPGMTANLSFQIEKRTDVLTIPNAALRFMPKPQQVRPSDRELAEGKPSGSAKAGSKASGRNRRQVVWVVADDLLRGVEVVTGLSDKKSTELVSGDLTQGQELVLGN